MKHKKFLSGKKPIIKGRPVVVMQRIAIFGVVAMILMSGATIVTQSDVVMANYYTEQINKLNKEINGYNERAKELSEQADSLANAVALLQNQQDALRAEIDLNKAKINELNEQIATNEAIIEQQSAVLGDTLVDLHLDKQITPLEILASSKSLSEYVDKEAQQTTVKEQVNSSINKINELKKKLQEEKATVERLLQDQENRNSQLATMRQEQQNLLDSTQGQEAAYKDMTSKNKKEIERLQAEQARINQSTTGGGTIVAGDPNRGGYPDRWNNAPINTFVDTWGMFSRQCVSYAAWRVHNAYGNMPYWGGIGNANQWDNNARRIGIPYGSTPKPGSVAQFDTGRYGHVAWVESVNGDGTFNLSEYNRNGDGKYYERRNVSASSVNMFIYFGEWKR